MRLRRLYCVRVAVLVCAACGGSGAPTVDDSGGTFSLDTDTFGTSEVSGGDSTTIADEKPNWDLGGGPTVCGSEGTNRFDILVVVENSGEMSAVQSRFAQTAISLVRSLEELTDAYGSPINADVQMMVTTTDVGNPACETDGDLEPARGAPLVEGCNARLAQFGATPETCTARCPVDVVPSETFIAFGGDGDSNVEGAEPVDVDGDGTAESPAAQAAACLAPVGLNGCAYPSALGAVRYALDPGAAWNQGDRPFVRPGSAVGIVVVQASPDCDVADPSVMDDPRFMALNPQTGEPETSQATCWNAGVSCQASEDDGTYASCAAVGDSLVPTSTYSEFLVSEVGTPGCTPIFMLALTGVPTVTWHEREAPFFPVEGGLDELIYRDVIDAPYPEGDLLPADTELGVTAADKQFAWGIGPGCTTLDQAENPISQGRPDPRTVEVCHGLDRPDDDSGRRCCVESVCDERHDGVVTCLQGLLLQSLPQTGPPW